MFLNISFGHGGRLAQGIEERLFAQNDAVQQAVDRSAWLIGCAGERNRD